MSIYRFSMREESQALTQALVAFFVVMLIMIGIAGTVYRVIAPDGWLADASSAACSRSPRSVCCSACSG